MPSVNPTHAAIIAYRAEHPDLSYQRANTILQKEMDTIRRKSGDKRAIHLPHPDPFSHGNWERTACGRDPEKVLTEDNRGVNYATCAACIRIYDGI